MKKAIRYVRMMALARNVHDAMLNKKRSNTPNAGDAYSKTK